MSSPSDAPEPSATPPPEGGATQGPDATAHTVPQQPVRDEQATEAHPSAGTTPDPAAVNPAAGIPATGNPVASNPVGPYPGTPYPAAYPPAGRAPMKSRTRFGLAVAGALVVGAVAGSAVTAAVVDRDGPHRHGPRDGNGRFDPHGWRMQPGGPGDHPEFGPQQQPVHRQLTAVVQEPSRLTPGGRPTVAE